MTTVSRSVGCGVVLSAALALLALLLDRSADPIIDEIEKVIVPCQHGGEWLSAKETCRCLGPWTGKYCGECACENGGVCDSNNIQVATPGTLWGCRCPDRLVGPLCEQCNAELTEDGRCAGPCQEGFTGPDCNRLCSATATFDDVVLDATGEYVREQDLLGYGGELHLCSGHGACDNVTGFCQCEPFYFPSEDGRSSCARTCAIVDGKLCAGHGQCGETAGVVSCACAFGYHLSSACDVACPGMDLDYVNEPCSGRGTCYLDAPKTAKCECGELFIGEACQHRCPTGAVIESSEACSGHGVCREDDSAGFTKAVCDCESPFQGPGCGCTRSLTCSGHGECRADGTCACDVDPLFGKPVFRGERCNECIAGHFGSDCRLQCSSFEPTDPAFVFEEGRNIHCHGRGTCAVANFGLADEAVVCGACTGNFATESHCEECKDDFYPKFAVMDGDETASCTTFANRATCNGAGEPKDTFGRKSDATEAQCVCDAPHADALSFCTDCELSYYPSNLREDPKGACSRRCVDKSLLEQGLPLSVPHIETLECVNDGVCADDGLSCICADGYSGVDCGIACGAPDESGKQCSGHGQCVSNVLQQLLEFEANVKGFTASRCECSPGDDVSEAERLAIFRGELVGETGEALTGRNKRDWYGDTCGFACLSAPWKDGTECNGEQCEVVPISDTSGSPIMSCTQDSQCGIYDASAKILKFYEGGAEKTVLTSDESKLRGAVSLSRRWSSRAGPFCHVPNTPLSVSVPNMQCVQRVNKDGEEADKQVECHSYHTPYDCLHKGEGACKYVDVCKAALEEFDTWSYCYELMRTQEPPALRTKVCAESCNATLLRNVEWGKKCAHYKNRLPTDVCPETAFNDVDALCDMADEAATDATDATDATALVSACESALPPASVVFDDSKLASPMDASDTSAYCWETSDQAGSVTYPFKFLPLLDTPEARHLQSTFHSLFFELGARDTCVADSRVDLSSCAKLPHADSAEAKVLYMCTSTVDNADVSVLESTDKSSMGVKCKALPTALDVSPFELVCAGTDGTNGINVEALSEIGLEDAVRLAARRGCALRAKSALHADSVAVSDDDALAICKAVLDAESPTACEQACGPEDVCSDLGVTHDGKRVLQCRRPDASDVGLDPVTGKCGNCLLGDCSITGREGGAEYRCVVPEADIATSVTPPTFEPCDDTLMLHADELGGGKSKVSSVQGEQHVVIHDDNETLPYETADDAAAAKPMRVEFDVHMDASGRGRVAVLGKNGTLVSLLLHYYGGFGYDVNAPTEADVACDAGQGDDCKFVVAPGVSYRVKMTFDWAAERVSVAFADQPVKSHNITMEADAFAGVAQSGTARVSQLWVFSAESETCASLHRGLGRSLTMQASHRPASGSPPTSMSFCAGVEKAVAEHVKNCPHERDAVFAVPWHNFCAYADHLQKLTATGDCGDWQGSYALATQCEPVLSKFSTPACARNAVTYDWETEYCVPLREDTRPDELGAANCSAECIAKVVGDDFAQLCDDREAYWDAATEQAKPDFLPSECSDNGKWADVDWIQFCTDKAENTAEGFCSSAACDCRGQGGWMAGDACELECPMANDYSPCSEDSLGGACLYRRRDSALADAFYEDPDNNKIKNHAVMQIQGRCSCVHPAALAEEGCKVECNAEDGNPVCNTETYVSNGEQWDISACDAGGSGVCRCMAPLARMKNETVSNWKGQTVDILSVEFGGFDAELDASTAFPSMSAFRLYAMQGAKELMTRYFGAGEFTWEDTKFRFESSPADFMCGDDKNRTCDFHDVVIAQSLYSSSSFYGGSCSRRCPGVDTGEDMVVMAAGAACVVNDAVTSGVDLVSEVGCQSECLDDFRCKFTRWDNVTSYCHMLRACDPAGQPPAITETWREKTLQRDPNLTPCSGRGQCGITGQCQCDPAKELSLTDPITGEKNLIPSNKRGGLASVKITTLDLTGYRGDDCGKVCPGYDETRKSMADVCSGHGVCTRSGACQCDVNWVGLNCELRCPVKDVAVEDDQTVCSGHGTCSEARIFSGYDATEEDSMRYYMVTEAYRKWHNECPSNTPIDYFVLPFENFPGSVASDRIRGGPNCERVPQEQDDPTLPFVQRPEIKLDGLVDYVFLDDEQAVSGESLASEVDGVSAFNRQGMFRRRFWYDDAGALRQQTLFVENFAKVESLGNATEVSYDRFFGYACSNVLDGAFATTTAETAADCAKLCESVSDCACFHYREHYHRKFVGQCVLGGKGPLTALPVEKVVSIHTTDGLLQKVFPEDASYPSATPTPFEEFTDNHVALHTDPNNPYSCRAPTTQLGANVASVTACAKLCVEKSADDSSGACVFFSYDPSSRRCSQVRTTSADCEEGTIPHPAGFYVVSIANTGAIAPTAYTRSGSARIFPTSVAKRGTVTGTYVGRARPGYETAIASCDCLSNAAWGFWDGHRCQTCQKHYGSKTCSRKCPGVTAAGTPCFGFGKCLWGSKMGDGEEFFEAKCLCGDPPAPYVDDLATVGVWNVEEFDLHVEATFSGLPPSEYYEDPRNYNFASSTCAGCKENFGGLNCASTCSYCLFGGACSFAPSSVSISVPCQCVGANFDSYNSCCPFGFSMIESLVHNDVVLLTTSLRRKRLSSQPTRAIYANVYHDKAIFPNIATSSEPSRRWCAPAPGVYESSWMHAASEAESTACSSEGVLRNRGVRKMTIGATPSKYFPQSCDELGTDAEGVNYWYPEEKLLWYAYPNRVFLNFDNDDAASAEYATGGVSVSAEEEAAVAECKALCQTDACTGFVIRRREVWETTRFCYVSNRTYVGAPTASAYPVNDPNSMYMITHKFTAYRKQRQPEYCVNAHDSSRLCVLGSVTYGDVPLCADTLIGDSTTLTMSNLGVQCEVRDGEEATVWRVGTAAECAAALPQNRRINDNTNLMSTVVPKANALLFGAYDNDELEASAGTSVQNFGIMRPENPCATLAGDYYWNKDDRSQCVSAATRQTCDVQDWKMCTNYDVTNRAMDALHPVHFTESAFKITASVDGGDVHTQSEMETAVFFSSSVNDKTPYSFVAPIDYAMPTYFVGPDEPKEPLAEMDHSCGTAGVDQCNLCEGACLSDAECATDLLTCEIDDKVTGILPTPATFEFAKAKVIRPYCEPGIPYRYQPLDIEWVFSACILKKDKVKAHVLSNQCSASKKCGLCQGVCQNDDDCGEGLECSTEDVSYCSGTPPSITTRLKNELAPIVGHCIKGPDYVTPVRALAVSVGKAFQRHNGVELFYAPRYFTYAYTLDIDKTTGDVTGVSGVYHVATTTTPMSDPPRSLADVQAYHNKIGDVAIPNCYMATSTDGSNAKGTYVCKAGQSFALTVEGRVPLTSRGGTSNTPPLSTATAEECAFRCDTVYGCTAAHWAQGDCYLFTFDPAQGCALFKDVESQQRQVTDNSNDDATAIQQCDSDCDSGNPGQCKFGLKCFERESGERVPGCKGGTRANHDVCIDPNIVHVGFVRNPDACQLCRSRGMVPHVDIAFTFTAHFEEAVYCKQAQLYDTTPVQHKQYYCALFPIKDNDGKLSWSQWEWGEEPGHYDVPWLRPRCPPTRAGMDSSMHTRTVHFGKTFDDTPLMVLTNHPRLTSYFECETACADSAHCRAWQFEERVVDDEITYLSGGWLRGTGGEARIHNNKLYTRPLYSTDETGTSKTHPAWKCLWREGSTWFMSTKLTGEIYSFVGLDTSFQSSGRTLDENSYSSDWEDDPCPPSSTTETTTSSVCTLYDSEPSLLATESVAADTFRATSTVGFLHRDYAPKTAFFDDGEFPACDCDDLNQLSYDCSCSRDAKMPFRTNATDDRYGCAGHGECSSLEYKCVCDDGYGWMWGLADAASDVPGHTCRQCPVGTFKSRYVDSCTSCAKGQYQDEEGQAECKFCPRGFTTAGVGRPLQHAEGATLYNPCPDSHPYLEPYDVTSTYFCYASENAQEGAVCAMHTANIPPPANGVWGSNQDACSHENVRTTVHADPCHLSITVEDCPVGKYADSRARCAHCPAGYESNEVNAASCSFTPCAAGTFTINDTVPIPGRCADCPEGYTNDAKGQTTCPLCALDFYRESAAACAACPEGYESLVVDASECTIIPCPKGTYLIDSTAVFHDQRCRDCPAGYQGLSGSAALDATHCESCEKGSFKAAAGKENCKECNFYYGFTTFSFPRVACEECPVGYHVTYLHECHQCDPEFREYSVSSADHPDGVAPTQCYRCPETKAYRYPQWCVDCGPGTYVNETGDCGCDVGYYTVDGDTTCHACPAGYHNQHYPKDVNACAQCDASVGWYQDETGQQWCKFCDYGHYFSVVDGKTECEACPVGWKNQYRPTEVNECVECPTGSDPSHLSGQSDCNICDYGQYYTLDANSNTITCHACPAGFENRHKPDAVNECAQCAKGRYQDATGQEFCKGCEGWTYTDELGQTECKGCPAGFDYKGMAEGCELCAIGRYQDEDGESDCKVCPEGKFVDTTGSDAVDDCEDIPGCVQGKWWNATGKECKYCRAGTTTPSFGYFSESECVACPDGKSSPGYPSGGGANLCTDCPAGYAMNQAQNEQGSCDELDPRNASYSECWLCLKCGPWYNRTAEEMVFNGEYSDETGSSECKVCPTGEVPMSQVHPDDRIEGQACMACADISSGSYTYENYQCVAT